MTEPTFRPPDQLGFVTTDLERTALDLGVLWSIRSWNLVRFDQQLLTFATYRGESGSFASRNAVSSDGRVGIVEPVVGPSLHLDALKERGEGLAYVTWVLDDLTGISVRMAEAGIEEVMRGGGHGLDGDGEFVYYDTRSVTGVYTQYTRPPRRRRDPSGVLHVDGQNTQTGLTGKPVAPGTSGTVQQNRNE